jgi:pyruvate/2-oxoglutarate dehydrogenase complex dihydrolipoamide dehydrogenase (E3) component
LVETYDAILIGSGQASGPLSTAFEAAGMKSILVERAFVGGTCINYGCTPTKTMIGSAAAAESARFAPRLGVETDRVVVDMPTVRQRKRMIVEQFRSGSERQIRNGGVEICLGVAEFRDSKCVRVSSNGVERDLTADIIVIDTGSRTKVPAIDGLSEVGFYDSTSIMELDHVPNRLVILGGGYIGVEFGQMFRRFGSEVTILQNGPSLLAREDQDVASAMADMLRADGIEIVLSADVTSVSGRGQEIVLRVETDAGRRELTASHLLVATGREPNVSDLHLQRAAIEQDERGFIRVDERLRTTAQGIYAVGDVTGGPAFTHISYDDFRVLRDTLIEGKDRTTSGRMIPYVVFTDPQLGRVGMSENEARQTGLNLGVAKTPMRDVARAIELGRTSGFMKAIVDMDSGQILGCAMLGMEGGEMMAMVQIAMMGQIPYGQLVDGIFAHPTLAEGINTLFSSLAS